MHDRKSVLTTLAIAKHTLRKQRMSIDSLSYGLGFDADRFILGSLCKRKHNFNGTEYSLRTQGKHPSCIECRKLSGKRWKDGNKDKGKLYKAKVKNKRIEQPVIDAELIKSLGYDPDATYLGNLCTRNHDNYQGQSVRSRKSGLCVQCGRLRHIPKPKRIKQTIGDKHYLGKLCKREHNYQDTGKSLRGLKSRECVECTAFCNREYPKTENGKKSTKARALRYSQSEAYQIWLARPQQEMFKSRREKAVSEIHYLGNLCKANHEYLTTNQSLKYINSANCVECSRISRIDRVKKKQEAALATGLIEGIHFLGDPCPEGILHIEAESGKTLRYISTGICVACRVGSGERYRKTESWKAVDRKRRHNRRAREKGVHQVPFTESEIKQLVEKFDGCCAYCGKNGKVTVDHFVPLIAGGSDCLGNFVPACTSCNSSKNDSDPSVWFKSRSFYSLKRWRKILKELGKTEANYSQIPLF